MITTCSPRDNPFDGSARLPFILRLPKTGPWQQTNQQVDHPVELRDILPTLLRFGRRRRARHH